MRYSFALVILCLSFHACTVEDTVFESPFTGYYSVTETCSGNQYTYELLVVSNSSDQYKITLFNLDSLGYGIGPYAITVGDSFTIPLQEVGRYDISGSGYLSADHDSIFYTWNGGPHGNCTAAGKLRDL